MVPLAHIAASRNFFGIAEAPCMSHTLNDPADFLHQEKRRFAVVGGPFVSQRGQRPGVRSQVRHTVTTAATIVVSAASDTITVRRRSARWAVRYRRHGGSFLPGGRIFPSRWGRSVPGSRSCRHHGQSLSGLPSQ